MPCNFVNIGSFLTKPVPIDRAHSGPSIGTGFVKTEPILTKFQGPMLTTRLVTPKINGAKFSHYLIRVDSNFLNTDPLTTILVPMENSHTALSNGADFVVQ